MGDARDNWQSARRLGIGGSDIGAVAGLNPWRGPYGVWRSKVLLESEQEETLRMLMGRKLEPILADICSARIGKVRRNSRLFRHPKMAHYLGTPDGFLEDGSLVSFKTTDARNAHRWEAGVPMEVQAQETWYMGILRAKGKPITTAHVAVLFGLGQLDIHRVEWDEQFYGTLCEAADSFWPFVERREPPPMDGTDSAWDALAKRFPYESKGEVLDGDESDQDAAKDYARLCEEIGRLEKAREIIRQRFADRIGTAEGIAGSWGKVSWTTTKGSVKWKEVAESMGATKEVAEAHRGESSRRLVVRLNRAGL